MIIISDSIWYKLYYDHVALHIIFIPVTLEILNLLMYYINIYGIN